jgi:YfiH family protein
VKLPAPFRREGDHIAIALRGAQALFTTRRGGVSAGPFATLNLGLFTDDDPRSVSENRERLAALVDVPRERFAQGCQVHGTHVRTLREPPDPKEDLADADGQATDLAGVAAIALVADCLPIALAGEGGVAILHAGWRGLAGGVVDAGVAALRDLGMQGPLEAAIGPGAGACCYEVGGDVLEAFAGSQNAVRRADRRAFLDLKAIARLRLRAAGVETIHDVDLCTICSDPGLFFSHRRDGGVTGRQAGVAWRA